MLQYDHRHPSIMVTSSQEGIILFPIFFSPLYYSLSGKLPK